MTRLCFRAVCLRAVLACLFVTLTRSSCAQSNVASPVIGEVWLSEPSVATPYIEAFHQGLRDLGYVEGQNIAIEARYAYGDPSRLPSLISELVSRKVTVLYVTPRGIPNAVRITKSTPIVSMGFGDPVAEGVVASLARPGVNVTGISL